jgi:predicted nucleic acid-binding protein
VSAVIDAGPLIWLARCSLLYLLKQGYTYIMITEAVYHEAVIAGLEKGYVDAEMIAMAIEEGWITVDKPLKAGIDEVKKVEAELGVQLGAGERESIALAKRKKETFLTNDEDAYTVGKHLGVEARGILYVLLEAVKKGVIERETAGKALGEMLNEGLWLSPEIVHLFHKKLDVLNKTQADR